jgi:hypothetical protein
MRNASFIFYDNGMAEFKSQVMTTFTHTKDVWHQRFVVTLSNGTSPLQWSFDGPEMSEQDNPIWYDFNVPGTSYAQGFFSTIQKLTWYGCC